MKESLNDSSWWNSGHKIRVGNDNAILLLGSGRERGLFVYMCVVISNSCNSTSVRDLLNLNIWITKILDILVLFETRLSYEANQAKYSFQVTEDLINLIAPLKLIESQLKTSSFQLYNLHATSKTLEGALFHFILLNIKGINEYDILEKVTKQIMLIPQDFKLFLKHIYQFHATNMLHVSNHKYVMEINSEVLGTFPWCLCILGGGRENRIMVGPFLIVRKEEGWGSCTLACGIPPVFQSNFYFIISNHQAKNKGNMYILHKGPPLYIVRQFEHISFSLGLLNGQNSATAILIQSKDIFKLWMMRAHWKTSVSLKKDSQLCRINKTKKRNKPKITIIFEKESLIIRSITGRSALQVAALTSSSWSHNPNKDENVKQQCSQRRDSVIVTDHLKISIPVSALSNLPLQWDSSQSFRNDVVQIGEQHGKEQHPSKVYDKKINFKWRKLCQYPPSPHDPMEKLVHMTLTFLSVHALSRTIQKKRKKEPLSHF
ncbi:hypothetical protein VP01_1879g2 [Puccinia sorghi]|uniref:Uncharacterized protein n=1 Tax=Puccinia sorghi TaxID=27349 RepID=A0A0L6VD13_9BASI|nr:hypothetical protein VP01_1879g2 [Puccinia sorghi]